MKQKLWKNNRINIKYRGFCGRKEPRWVCRLLTALAFLAAVCTFAGCQRNPDLETISKTELLMDTVVQIKLWDCQDESLLEDAMELCADLEKQFSSQIEDSEISRINDAGGKPVKISENTGALLEIGRKYETLSEGRFSMEIGPLSSLWDFHPESAYKPSQAEIEAATAVVQSSSLQLKEDQAALTPDGARLDLGGIAKGYIADQLKEYLKERGIRHGIISLGGNVLTIGSKPDGSPFTVGIQRPFAEENEMITAVYASDSSVVTSGIYQRYFEQEGALYHHILDPETGYPAKTDLYSVTVLSSRSVDGDALSTICMLFGLEKGKQLIEATEGAEAVFVTDEEKVIYTSGITEDQIAG